MSDLPSEMRACATPEAAAEVMRLRLLVADVAPIPAEELEAARRVLRDRQGRGR